MSEVIKLKLRDEINEKFKWKVDKLYNNDNIWEEDFIKLQQLSSRITQFKGKLHEGKQLLEYLKNYIEISSLFEDLAVYAHLRSDEDTTNSKYQVIKEKINISMDKRCKQEVSTRVFSSYCGNLTFQLKTIKVYDFFHMFALTKRLNKSINISILPTCYSLEDFVTENVTFLSDSNEFSPYKSGDDPSEVFQIREYREGDKTSRIHRKLSYKYNEIMMKEYSYPINTKILILFDIYCGQDINNRLEVVDSLLHCYHHPAQDLFHPHHFLLFR